MVRLELIDLVKEQFPEIDISTKDDVIKLSKIIKAEIKLNEDISTQDLEDLVSFLLNHGNKFSALTDHKNISIILRGEGERITFSPFKDKLPAETIHQFQTIFSENISNYIKQSIILNNWNNLRSLFTVYPFIASEAVKLNTLEALHLKNQALLLALRNGEYVVFVEQNTYATDGAYFSMLSVVDNLYFDDDLRDINNGITDCRKNMVELPVLGSIMHAITFYNAHDDVLNMILGANKKAAFAMLNIHTNTNIYHRTRAGEIVLYFLIFIFIAFFVIMVGPHVPRGVFIVLILLVKLVFFLSKK